MSEMKSIGLFAVALTLIAVFWLHLYKLESECEAKGGVMVRGLVGFKCVKLNSAQPESEVGE